MEEVKEEFKVSDYAKKFKASERIMKDEFLPKYQLAKKRLRAEHEVKGRGTKRLTHEQVALVYSIGTNFVNSVYFKSPNVNFTARDLNQRVLVENTENKVNDWLGDNRIKKLVKRVIWDAYEGGFGAIFTDYEYDDMDDENNPLMRSEVLAGENGEPVETQVQETDDEGKPLFNRIVLKNEITAQRIRPDLVRFPRGFDFDNYQDSPWLGFDVIVPIEEAKENDDWDEAARGKLEGSKFEKLSSASDRNSSKSPDEDLYVKISYCFIRPEHPEIQPFKLCVFSCDNEESPLKVTDFKKGHKGYPIKFVYFNPLDDDCPYPNGDPWMFESQLNAVDEWWKKVVRHVKRSNPKIVYDSGEVTPQEAQKLKSNNDNEVVGIANKKQRDLRALITELNSTTVNPDIHKLWESARQLLDQIAPRAAASQGSSQSDTATEAKIEQAGEMIDVDARIDDVRDFIKDICLDVAGMLENVAAPISTPVTYQEESGDDITSHEELGSESFSSNVAIDVDVESMQSQNKDVVRRQLIDALGLFVKLGQQLQASGKALNWPFWIEQLMDTMNIKNIEKGFVDLPPMMPLDPVAQSVSQSVAQGVDQSVDQSIPQGVEQGVEMPPEAIEAGLAQRV